MSKQYRLEPQYYPSRTEWAEYTIYHETPLPQITRIVMNAWDLPVFEINGNKVTQLAIVVNSNIGLLGSTGAERTSVLAGASVRQFIFNLGADGKWTPLNGIVNLDYPSKSSQFSFRLRYCDPLTRQFYNMARTPKRNWTATVTIV